MASLSEPSEASFESFSKLPTEIRLKIWRLALPSDGRIVRLCRDDFTSPRGDFPSWILFDDFVIIPTCRPPAVLQVNVEARLEGLKLNKLCFPTASFRGPTKAAEVYFTPLDFIYLSSNASPFGDWSHVYRGVCPQPGVADVTIALSTLITSLPSEQLDGIHNLAIDVPYGSGFAMLDMFMETVQKFKGLKLFFVVLIVGQAYQKGDIFTHPPEDVQRETFSMELRMQTAFKHGWKDHEQDTPECRVVFLGREDALE